MSDIDRSARPKVFPTETSVRPPPQQSQQRRELHDEQVRRDEWEEMYNRLVSGTELFVGAEVERLRAELAAVDEALGDFLVPDTEDHGVYRLQKELSATKRVAALWFRKTMRHKHETYRVEAELDRVHQDAQDQSDEVQELWLSPCEAEGLRRQLAQAVVAQADAELAAHVHDKSCGELAQTVYTERQLRREAEQGRRDALKTAQNRTIRLEQAEHRARSAEQRAERAEALAALVNEGAAELLERLAKYADTWGDWDTCSDDTGAAHDLATRIREALGR